MRVLVILTYYRPHWTGLTRYAALLAEELAARGHQVTVLTSRHSRSLAAEERLGGLRVIRLPPLARISRGMLLPGFPRALERLVPQHDVVHLHVPMAEAALVAWRCRRHRVPLVVAHHGDLVMPAGPGNRVVERAVTASMLVAAHLADVVTAYSEDYADHSDFLVHVRAKVTAIPPPIDIPAPSAGAAARWKHELRLDGRRLIGFVGRFVQEKGFDLLLRALPDLLVREPASHLVFAGERAVVYERFYDRCRPLLAASAGRITELGLLRDRQQLADFYAMCDVVALPSRSDCLAVVQVEAMLAGTPVVATNIPGARTVVQTTGMGRLVPAESPRALANGLVEVLRHRGQYVRPRAPIAAHYAPATACDLHTQLFRELESRRLVLSTATVREAIQNTERRTAHPAPVRPAALDHRDRTRLDRLLANEMDMAFRRRVPRLIEYLELQDGDRVLDCGCGPGFALMAMSRLRRLRLVGLDADPNRLSGLASACPSAALVAGDAHHLPFPDGTFDKILLSEVLEHLEDDARALREVRRVLRPGGLLAVSVPHLRFPWLWDPISRAWTAIGGRPLRDGPLVGIWTNHLRLYTSDLLATRLQRAGFVVDCCEESTHYCVPLAHFLVYGVGKPLFERRWLPSALHRAADRFGGEGARPSALNPIELVRRVMRSVDRLNDRPTSAGRRTFVNVLARARCSVRE